MSLAGSIRAKGLTGYAARAAMIASRFGPTSAVMDRALRRYVEITEAYGTRPTLPITASVLARHPHVIRRFADRGVEFAVHGLVHGDHHDYGFDEQWRSLIQAEARFRRAGIAYTGFRAPYLRYNRDTDRALLRLRYHYHSSQAVAFPVLDDLNGRGEAYQRALAYYDAHDALATAVRPRDADGLIHLPVAMPDDEIMIDRLRLSPRAQKSAWLDILDLTYRRGELFTVQLHPERIFHAGPALSAVLDHARGRTPAVWLATLGEIAAWWARRREARLEVRGIGENSYHIEFAGDADATLFGRNLEGVEAHEWFGHDRLVDARAFELRSTKKPVVGVSKATPLPVREFLHEEGFVVEVADDPGRVGAYLDLGPDWQEQGVLAAIEAAPGPLVRVGRWPRGARSALAVSGDIDAITLQDFALRFYETSAMRRLRHDRWPATEPVVAPV